MGLDDHLLAFLVLLCYPGDSCTCNSGVPVEQLFVDPTA